MLRKLKFSHWWPKITPEYFVVGLQVSTFRAYEWRKDYYYRSQLGRDFSFHISSKSKLENDKRWYLSPSIGNSVLQHVDYIWSKELDEEIIKKDTYPDWGHEQWDELMKHYYRMENPFLIWLKLEVKEVIDITELLRIRGTHPGEKFHWASKIDDWSVKD